jgi:hypothetical protein
MVPSLEDRLWIDWVEKLLGTPAGHSPMPEFPPQLFYCCLHEQPDHLVPGYALAPGPVDVVDQVVHPGCVLTHGPELPPALGGNRSLVEGLALEGPIAWVPHPITGALQPFWLNSELEDVLSRRRSAVAATELPSHLGSVLTMAGILVQPCDIEKMTVVASKLAETAGMQFRDRGYTPVSGLIHPFHVAALRRYFRHCIRKGGMHLGDTQSPRRYVAHNDSVARFFHHQLAAAVALFAGEPIKPSYVYAASYQGGAKLERHTDREQCEFSISFCLDYSPEPSLSTGWPLQLHTHQGTVTVYQALGDALLYRGRQLPHSRATLRQGHTSTSIFFHYVRENFAGPLN